VEIYQAFLREFSAALAAAGTNGSLSVDIDHCCHGQNDTGYACNGERIQPGIVHWPTFHLVFSLTNDRFTKTGSGINVGKPDKKNTAFEQAPVMQAT